MSKLPKEIWIVAAKRTPFGTLSGAFKKISAIDLGVHASKAALTQSGLNADEVDQVILGTMCDLDSYLEEDIVCVLAENEMSAREVGVVAGYPISSFDWLLRF